MLCCTEGEMRNEWRLVATAFPRVTGQEDAQPLPSLSGPAQPPGSIYLEMEICYVL